MSSTVSGTRITGMATGMDTDSMIKAMLTADQEKIDNVKAEEQILTWQQEAYQEIIGDVKSLTDKYFSVTSPDSILSSKNWSTVSIESTNSSVVTATASSGTSNINYEFDIQSLATAPKLSTTTASNGVKITPDATLESLGITGLVEFAVKTSDGVSEAITLEETDTVETMIKKLNEASGGNYKASFSEMTGEFKIESNKTGENSTIQIVDVLSEQQSDALDFLSNTQTSSNFSSEQKGTNTNIIVKDAEGNKLTTLNKETNSFSIDGVNYTFHSTGQSKVTSKENSDKVVENMKNFVEDYNKLMDKIYKDLIEKKNKDYPPLTDEQKKEMSEDEIKKWEEKAKAGILKNDSDLRKFMDDMNKAIFGDNTEFMLSIGISGPTDYNKKGQLTFDEEKFRKAMTENGDEIYKKVAGNSDSILENVKKTINNYVGSSSSVFAKKAGIEGTSSLANNYYSDEIKKKEELIKELTNKMNKKEDSLYKKFANLESTMNKLNAQMQQFMQS